MFLQEETLRTGAKYIFSLLLIIQVSDEIIHPRRELGYLYIQSKSHWSRAAPKHQAFIFTLWPTSRGQFEFWPLWHRHGFWPSATGWSTLKGRRAIGLCCIYFSSFDRNKETHISPGLLSASTVPGTMQWGIRGKVSSLKDVILSLETPSVQSKRDPVNLSRVLWLEQGCSVRPIEASGSVWLEEHGRKVFLRV